MTRIPGYAANSPDERGVVERVVCDDCGKEEETNGMRAKPRGWAMVLQKGDTPPKHYCTGCKKQKKQSGPVLRSVVERAKV